MLNSRDFGNLDKSVGSDRYGESDEFGNSVDMTWLDFDGTVESGGTFKFGDSDDTGKFGDLGRYGGSGDYGVSSKSSDPPYKEKLYPPSQRYSLAPSSSWVDW